ncbi:unnamed protein product [Meganyctiphanes norvegica]|uniref:Protein-lysine N-methyltransferase SMYD4 n=1 Tax=Meganyctiphanes norvegica TaxID=48144 RepID=A0AAV2Q6L8_MEGNR
MEQFTFERLFNSLLTKLKESGKVVEVSNHFKPTESIQNMFYYLWNFEDAHHCLKPKCSLSVKSDVESDKLRAEGNKFYQKKHLKQALELYNKSIMAATHPKMKLKENLSPEQKCDTEYKALSLGFANRSAILIELEQYEKCICDIDLALYYGYPKLLHSKLAERKAKCFLALKKYKEAEEIVEGAIKDLDALNLEESKSRTTRDALVQLLQQCQQNAISNGKENIIDANVNQYEVHCLGIGMSSLTNDQLLFKYRNPQAPSLIESNPNIPSLSSAVTLEYKPDRGRFLVATKDINPGEVVVYEKPFSSTLLLNNKEILNTHCYYCLALCLTPLPCPTCKLVVFCSDTCQKSGLLENHHVECSSLPMLADLEIGRNAILAHKIVAQMTFSKLKSLIPIYEEEIKQRSPKEYGLNEKNIYDSSDYRTIYNLVGNSNQRSVADLFKRTAMSFVITKLLIQSKTFFVDEFGSAFNPSEEDVMLIGTVLMVHMMNLPCNAHSITELQVNVDSFRDSESQEIGAGAFPVLSLCNHSCNPATSRSSYGSVEVLLAVRLIPAGSEVTDSYGSHFSFQDKKDRNLSLEQQYCFKCNCDACMFNWPIYDCLPISPSIRTSEIIMDKKLDESELDSKKSLQIQLKKVESDFHIYYNKILVGDVSEENTNAMIEMVEFLDRYCEIPSRLYFEAQETLKHCLDRKSASNFIRREV